MKLSNIEYLNVGYADRSDLTDAKNERNNLRKMLYRTRGNDYQFPDGSVFIAEEANKRVEELTNCIIPKLHRDMTEQRWTDVLSVTGGI